MGETLVQRHGFTRRTYSLGPEGIRVDERSPFTARSQVVPYEVLLGERDDVLTSSKLSFWLMVFCACAAVGTAFVPDAEREAPFFWGACAGLAGVFFRASRRDQLGFADGERFIRFLRGRPSPKALDEFLALALGEARARARRRVLPLRPSGDPGLDRERATWLRNKGIVGPEELAEFERTLDELARMGEGPRPRFDVEIN